MAFPDDKFAEKLGFDLSVPRKALPGLVEISYDFVGRDYRKDSDGDVMKAAQTLIELRYQPPANVAIIGLYEGSDDFWVIERIVPAGEGVKSTVYTARIKHCVHKRIATGTGYQDEYKVLLRVEDPT